jgi:hypothetical protein
MGYPLPPRPSGLKQPPLHLSVLEKFMLALLIKGAVICMMIIYYYDRHPMKKEAFNVCMICGACLVYILFAPILYLSVKRSERSD